MSLTEKKNGVTTPNPNEFQFALPQEKQKFSEFIYNKKDGTIFGRTINSWGRLFIFYAIFYAVLAGMFAICLGGLFASLSDREPKWKLDSSLIGSNPGLGFRPLSNETERGSVIQFDKEKPQEAKYWKELMDDFLTPYNTTVGLNRKVCDFDVKKDPQKVCIVDLSTFGPCAPKHGYGYKNGRPCVFLKLNKIYNWVPEYYDDVNNLPEDMPADLIEHINSLDQTKRQQIWISCQGQWSVDKENLGTLQYFPSRGFPSFYYPFKNQFDYLSPLVAVQFESFKPNQFLNVECRAWAKNIIYKGSVRDRMGSVTFQLNVD